MDEFTLIEIAKRFRAIEDAAEQVDRRLETLQKNYDPIEPRYDEMVEIRAALEVAIEKGREDMVAMQEAIRGRK